MEVEFNSGCDFIKSQVRQFVDSNKEKLEVYDISKAGHHTREVIDVKKLIKLLDIL